MVGAAAATSDLATSGPATLGDVLRRNARRLGAKTAFVDDRGDISFAGFNSRANRLGDALLRLGLRRGDRIAVLSRNRIEYVEIHAAAKAGLVAVPLNWRLSPSELLAVVQDCAPAALFVEEEQVAAMETARGQLGTVRHFVVLGPARAGWTAYEALLAAGEDREPEEEPGPQDIACITYTSGTTGRPKGAMLRHGALVENMLDAAGGAMGLAGDDIALAAMPLFHVGGMWYHLQASFAAGCTTVIRPAFAATDALEAVARHGVTNLHLVPTMLGDLVARPEAASAARSLRLVFYAASSIPVDLLRRAMRMLGHCRFLQCYGSTEAGMVTALGPADHERAVGETGREHLLASCGRALGRVEIRIEGGIEDGAGGGVGEILVRGPKLMAGYWRREEADRAALPDGWLRTGDLGRLDPEGYLYVVDRRSDMVISGGENVYPSEVEGVLLAHPAVAEAAVLGVSDPRWVERVVAAVVLRPGAAATPEEIIRFARDRIAPYKCPKEVLLLDGLPRSGAGKVLRKELRGRFEGPAAACPGRGGVRTPENMEWRNG